MLSTRSIPISVSEENKPILADLVRRASIASHKLQKDFALAEDKSLAKEIKEKYGLSAKHIDYLQKDAVAAGDAALAREKMLAKQLQELEGKLLKAKDAKKKDIIRKKIVRKKRAMNRPIVFGGRHRLRMLSRGTAKDAEKLKREYRNARTTPLFFQGEAIRKGSRFFDLSDMVNGNAVLTYSRNLRIPISFVPKEGKEKLLFQQLSAMAEARIMPIAVRLTADAISFTYDDHLLHGRNLRPSKQFYAEVKSLGLPEADSKQLKAKEFKRLQARLLEQGNKLADRYAAIDLNPNGIGVFIADKCEGGFDVVDKFFLDFDALLSTTISFNKRKHETSALFKELFNCLSHYRCGTLIHEDLNLENKDLGSRVGNRKVNNHWLRGKAKQLIDKRVVESEMLLVEVNPVYSSFIGNILHNEYDPIAASMELMRRGINKYEKDGFYPAFRTKDVINGLGAKLPEKMYDEVLGCENWAGLSRLFSMRSWSVRRKREEFLFSGQQLASRKSGTKCLRFHDIPCVV